jgi:STE24 endopeptidase
LVLFFKKEHSFLRLAFFWSLSMPLLLLLVIAVTVLEAAWSFYLSARQISYVRAHAGTVPGDYVGLVGPEEHRKAADYTIARERTAVVRGVVSLVVGLVMLGGGYDWLYGVLAGRVPASLALSVGFLLAVAAIDVVVGLPFSIYSTFVTEARFGFNRTTARLFVIDRLRGWAIGLVIAVPVLAVVLWAMRQVSGLWWLYTWFGLLVLMAVLPTVAIRVVMPWFNKFSPLPEGELKSTVERLLGECGFRSSGLFTMDASKRSGHGNAFFTGFGRSKRIVLFDTLVEGSPVDEVKAIVAHELGHYARHHVVYGMVRSAAMSFVGLFVFGWLSAQPWLLPQMGLRHSDPALSLLACFLAWSVIGPLGSLLGNWISRRNEFEADFYAGERAGRDAMVAALVRLSRENASTLTPDPLYALYHFSHPPVPVRVRRLRDGGPAAAAA